MPPLPAELRSSLETSILNAREAAERAAESALLALAVNRDRSFPTMGDDQRSQRNALRARARQLRDELHPDGWEPLLEEVAYVGWHRMLFARFLSENDLLMHPDGVPVTLQECADLAAEEGEPDAWSVAASYASLMLPGIFRQEDPSAQVRFAPEGRIQLERILKNMPQIFFTAEDALGWVYQFWQSKKKDEVNASERKIGGADLYPVTQLFTEDYMVRFLLENSLGAWWAARHPNSPLIKEWNYLRWRDEIDDTVEIDTDGVRIPAAGTLPGWPDRAAEITMMDPCCGSGHFLVVAFEMLRKIRQEDEGLEVTQASDYVLRDNLFGLEIDPRCTQIAAFALAFAAWKIGGYREIPFPKIACSGIPVQGTLENWLELAGNDSRLANSLSRLHYLFENASTLGSLINPSDVPFQERMFSSDYSQVEPLIKKALILENGTQDPVKELFGLSTFDLAKAASYLSTQYTLVATNIPYLGQKRQNNVLKEFSEHNYPLSKADLATVFIERCRSMTKPDCTYALVTPQNWLFQKSSDQIRKYLLRTQLWIHICRLGSGAFETISGEVVNVILTIISNVAPFNESEFSHIDVSNKKSPTKKAQGLQISKVNSVSQSEQLKNPSSRVYLDESITKTFLRDYVISSSGMLTGDRNRFYRYFWEVPVIDENWEYSETSVSETIPYGGRSQIIYYQKGKGELFELAKSLKHLNNAVQNWQRGQYVWGKQGVAIKMTGKLAATIYTGDIFDNTNVVICPRNSENLAPIWAFCSSPNFDQTIRKYNQKLSVDPSYLTGIPFDLDKWKSIADLSTPIPELYSNDPTQWLFNGHPNGSTHPLQVGVTRLLGYKWPQQEKDDLDIYSDKDGIVCLLPIAGEQPAHERLRALIEVSFGSEWSQKHQDKLLANSKFAGKSLNTWLTDGFFKQHNKLFQYRPFIWHIWDGINDGFSAFVNYHKLDHALLGRLIYTYLGDWINRQRQDVEAGVAGADGRLVAALQLKEKLELIREGEPPYDIYVRWKPLHEQAIGWNPDLNDGVRLNIRPFVTAGVLRSKFTINWNKDRGKNPDGIERINNLHFTIADKLDARKAAGLI